MFSFCLSEFGAEGFSGQSFSYGGSFRADLPSQNQNQNQGPAPGIGFAQDPGSGPSGPPASNYNNIQIPPGAHAPANTPAELPPPSGTTLNTPTPAEDFTLQPSHFLPVILISEIET